MSEMSNEELSQKMKEVKAKIEDSEKKKMQLTVKKDDLQGKIKEMEPKIQEAFGTTDINELLAKKATFIDELSAIEL